MAYSTIAALTTAVGGAAKYVQLTATPGGTVADDAVGSAAIAEADALINSYASKRDLVPYAPVPSTIAIMSTRIAKFVLRRNRGALAPDDVPIYELDVKWLVALSKGEVTSGQDPALTPASSLSVDVAGERETTKEVSRRKLEGFW